MKEPAICENHLYQKAYRNGKKYMGKYVVVYILRDWHAKYIADSRPDKKMINRLGIAVSKKNGKAVVRNREKRIIREGYRSVKQAYDIKRGYLIVIAARKECINAKSTDIAEEIKEAFYRLDFMKSR